MLGTVTSVLQCPLPFVVLRRLGLLYLHLQQVRLASAPNDIMEFFRPYLMLILIQHGHRTDLAEILLHPNREWAIIMAWVIGIKY